jgi:hypothetical protein
MSLISIVFLAIIIFISDLSAQVLISEFDKNRIVAEVDSLKISAEEFFYSYEYGPAFVKRKPESKERYLNYMINEKLLALDGFSRGLDSAEEAREIITEFISDIATEELFKQDILSKVEIEESEIDTILNKKQLELEIKWLYSDSEKGIKRVLAELKEGIPFDSLFDSQINDSVFYDDRYMKINRYKLEQKNSLLAGIIDSLKAGEISLPIHTEDGWYIVKLDNVWENIITNQTEYERLRQEAVNALTKNKMDILSDKYVNELLYENEPVIKRDAFNLLRSYLGNYILDSVKYNEWNLTSKLNEAKKNLDLSGENYREAMLVETKNGNFTLEDFITWYRNRSQYIKLNKSDLQNFSISIENLIWQMIRDRLLFDRAKERGLDRSESVIKQSQWWRDKIVSAIVKNEIANSILMKEDEVKAEETEEVASVKSSEEYNAKLLRKILSLKQNHSIKINEVVLDDIPVSAENDPKAIELYTVKRGGLIPRLPYPTIDYDWINWE